MNDRTSKHESLRRKYLSLGLGELFASVAFALVYSWSVLPRVGSPTDRTVLLVALAPLVFVLVQGGVYWLLARRWVQVGSMPFRMARFAQALSIVNVGMLVVCAVIIALNLPTGWRLRGLAVGVWMFAVVEYLNYYVVRLAYPATRWFGLVTQWRTPRLILDIRSAH